MITVETWGKVIAEMQYVVDNHQSIPHNIDMLKLYRRLYDQHKLKHGSFKGYLSDDDGKYEQKMEERYSWILCEMNQTIEDLV